METSTSWWGFSCCFVSGGSSDSNGPACRTTGCSRVFGWASESRSRASPCCSFLCCCPAAADSPRASAVWERCSRSAQPFMGLAFFTCCVPRTFVRRSLAIDRWRDGSVSPVGFICSAGDSWREPYAGVFTSVILVLGIVLAAAAYRDRIATPERLVASACLVLVLVPALGPGYGPQYFYWFWPILLVAYALGSARFHRWVLGFGLVAAATYVIEYALAPVLGAFLAMRFPATRNFLFRPGSFRMFTVVGTPLWLAYLGLLVGLAGQFRESSSFPRRSDVSGSPLRSGTAESPAGSAPLS